jgi:hypothetical protein
VKPKPSENILPRAKFETDFAHRGGLRKLEWGARHDLAAFPGPCWSLSWSLLSFCWSTGAHGGTVACYREPRAALEPSRGLKILVPSVHILVPSMLPRGLHWNRPETGGYMVMILRGYSECNAGHSSKGHNKHSEMPKGTVGIST